MATTEQPGTGRAKLVGSSGKTIPPGTAHLASAKILNIAISTKHGIELSRALRYKNTSYAKRFLENVVAGTSPVPFRRFKGDVGHKAGMAAGRYPQKAAKEFLRLVKSVEANAQDKGLDTSNLKIVKILANKASIPTTGGRQRSGTKRSHIEIAVKEGKSVGKKAPAKKAKVEAPKAEVKEVAKVEEKKEEVKAEPEVAEKAAPETAEKKSEGAPVEETKEEVQAQEKAPVVKEEDATETTANTNESTEEAAPARGEKIEEPVAEKTNDAQESQEETSGEKTE